MNSLKERKQYISKRAKINKYLTEIESLYDIYINELNKDKINQCKALFEIKSYIKNIEKTNLTKQEKKESKNDIREINKTIKEIKCKL